MKQTSLEGIVHVEEYKRVLDMAIMRESGIQYKKDPYNAEIVKQASAILGPNDPNDPNFNFLMRAPGHAVVDMINNYQTDEQNDKEARESYGKIKEGLYNGFKESIDKTIVHIEKNLQEQIKNDKNLKDATEEQKDALYKNNIKENIYMSIGNALLSSRLTPKEGSKLAQLYAEIKQLKENPEKSKEYAKELMVQERRLPSYAKYFLEGNSEEMIAMKTKHLAKEALKEEKGGFTLDMEKFKKAFDNYETGLGLVYSNYEVSQKIAEAQAKGAK